MSKWVPPEDRKVGHGHVVVGVRGIRKQRNRIVLFFPEGRHVVSCDDDIEDLHLKMNENDMGKLTPGELRTVIHDAEAQMKMYGAYLWGLNPSACALNMKPAGIMTGNGVVSADFYGQIIRHLKSLKRIVADVIEDEEMSLRWFQKDGLVLRYKMLATKQKYRASGGIAACHSFDKRKKKEHDGIKRLAALFPNLVAYDPNKKSDITRPSSFQGLHNHPGLPNRGTGAPEVWIPPGLRGADEPSASSSKVLEDKPEAAKPEVAKRPASEVEPENPEVKRQKVEPENPSVGISDKAVEAAAAAVVSRIATPQA